MPEDEADRRRPLYDTSYNRDLVAPLAAGEYGASFRFSIVDETWERATKSDFSNPDKLPSRTVKDLELVEVSVVTFPAYTSSTSSAGPAAGRARFQPISQAEFIASLSRDLEGRGAR